MRSVLNGRMIIPRAMGMRLRYPLLRCRVQLRYSQRVLVNMAAMGTVQVPVMGEVAMALVPYGHMAATGGMLMVMPAMQHLVRGRRRSDDHRGG